MTLRELTGKESGVVVYQNLAIICNWSGIDGLPVMSMFGIMGDGLEIDEVEPRYYDDLSDFFDGVEVYSVNDSDQLPSSGWVYDLGDAIVVTNDDWN